MPSETTSVVQLVKANDGKIYRVSDDQEVTRESLTDTVGKAQSLLAKAQENLHQYDTLTAPQNETPTPETTPEAPVETPVEAAPVETPAPVEQPVPAAEEPTPAEQAAEIAEDAQELAEDLAAAEVPAPVAPVAEQPAPAPIADVTPAPAPETPAEAPVPQPIEVQ